MPTEPTTEHIWLKRLVGAWNMEYPSHDGEGTMKGTETVRALGDLWVICEGRTQMPDGTPGGTVMSLGYDAGAGKVVGSWIGSMMTYMWVYEGHLDAASDRLTLATRGPAFDEAGGIAEYQDIITFEGEDSRVLESRVRRADGTWHDLFTVRYTRAG